MSLTVAAQALVAAAALALLPAAQAHMTMFHPSVYGFNRGDSNVQPLSGQSFNNWVRLFFQSRARRTGMYDGKSKVVAGWRYGRAHCHYIESTSAGPS